MKSTKNKLLSSIATLCVCFAMLIGSTYAWFTDTASTGINKIQAGNLDVEFYRGTKNPSNKITTSTKLFDTDINDKIILWEPGVVSVEKLIVVNEGNLALKYKMGISDLVGGIDYNYVIEAGTTTPTEKSLLDVLYVYTSSNNIDVNTARSLTSANGILLKNFIKNNNFLSGELDRNGDTDEISVAIYWPESSRDNDYNVNNGRTVSALSSGSQESLVVNFPVTLAATQLTSESDSFDDQYDANATYPFVLPESTITTVETPITDFYEDYNGNTTITKNSSTNLQEKITVTATSATSINLDVEYTYGDSIVHKFTEVREKTYPLSKYLTDVTVTHSNVSMTKCSTKSDYDGKPDTAYFYDPATGLLYVKSSMYSTFTVTYKHNFVAVVDGEGYTDLQKAIDSINSSEEVEVNLVDSIDTPSTTYRINNKKVIINLNGQTISGSGYVGTLCVNNGKLTVNGPGKVIGNDDQNYGMAICASNGEVVINGGEYTNTLNHVDDQMDMIYASGNSKIIINDGTFKCVTPKWTLNIKDADYESGSSVIAVNGGTFYNYNPAKATHESPVANLVANGYGVIKDGDYYNVIQGNFAKDEESLKNLISQGGTVYLAEDIELTAPLSVTGNVTLVGNGISTISKNSINVSTTGNVKFENMEFANPTNKNKNASSVYASGLKGRITFENCTFTNPQWECIQITPMDGAEIVVNNCKFIADGTGTYAHGTKVERLLHIQNTDDTGDYKSTITNNTFVGVDLCRNAVIDVDDISSFDHVICGENTFANHDNTSVSTMADGMIYVNINRKYDAANVATKTFAQFTQNPAAALHH